MDAKSYNRYLSIIKTANNMSDKARAKETLKQVQADMVSQYGLNDSDVDYLIRQFRFNV